jgi:hypothetical protein
MELITAEQLEPACRKIRELIPSPFLDNHEPSFIDAPNFLGTGFESLGILRPRTDKNKHHHRPREGHVAVAVASQLD